MARLTLTPPSLDELHGRTNSFLDDTTAYLSTLATPIEPLEEFLSVLALTSSLLRVLRLREGELGLDFCEKFSFWNPLVRDQEVALAEVNNVVVRGRSSRIWENSSCYSSSFPASSFNGKKDRWHHVCGGEDNARRLRSRVFVEKYRVRVLIDAVTWWGLRRMEHRSLEQERVFQEIEGRLGVVTERLVGVWRDYVPRLRALERGEGRVSDLSELQRQRFLQLRMGNGGQSQNQSQSSAPPRYEGSMPSSATLDEKRVLGRMDNCGSCSSNPLTTNTTTTPTITYETYLLRQNLPTTSLKSSTHLLALPIPFSKTYTHVPATHYIKPFPSNPSAISTYLRASISTFSPPRSPFPFSIFASANPTWDEDSHLQNLGRKVLSIPETAQWEIQKLLETRESSSLGEREYELFGLVERPRRKINYSSVSVSGRGQNQNRKRRGWFRASSPSSVSHGGRVEKKTWFGRAKTVKRDKRDQVEYILILRGKSLGCEVAGNGNGDGANAEEMRKVQERQLAAMKARVHAQAQNLARKEQGKKTVLSQEEAERKMVEMCNDLFRLASVEGEGDGDEEMDVDVDFDFDGECESDTDSDSDASDGDEEVGDEEGIQDSEKTLV